jgi:CBS domain-containing protein
MTMNIRRLMTAEPAFCTPTTNLRDVAEMMATCDCGAIPVFSDKEGMKPVGVVTDRDITIRIVAKGQNPLEKNAVDAMTTIKADADMETAAGLMKKNQVRRLIVVNEDGACVGMLAQADLALEDSDRKTGDLVEKVSQPNRKVAEPISG